jgi:transposase
MGYVHSDADRLLAAAEFARAKSVEEVAMKTGVSAPTLYRWLQHDENFLEMLKELTDRRLVKIQPRVDAALLEILEDEDANGRVPAAKLLSERGGRTEVGTRDKGMEDFVKRYEGEDKAALQYYLKHGSFPVSDAEAVLSDEVEGVH